MNFSFFKPMVMKVLGWLAGLKLSDVIAASEAVSAGIDALDIIKKAFKRIREALKDGDYGDVLDELSTIDGVLDNLKAAHPNVETLTSHVVNELQDYLHNEAVIAEDKANGLDDDKLAALDGIDKFITRRGNGDLDVEELGTRAVAFNEESLVKKRITA